MFDKRLYKANAIGLKFRTIFDPAGKRSRKLNALRPKRYQRKRTTPEVKGICQ